MLSINVLEIGYKNAYTIYRISINYKLKLFVQMHLIASTLRVVMGLCSRDPPYRYRLCRIAMWAAPLNAFYCRRILFFLLQKCKAHWTNYECHHNHLRLRKIVDDYRSNEVWISCVCVPLVHSFSYTSICKCTLFGEYFIGFRYIN